jgi:hypothetical protein
LQAEHGSGSRRIYNFDDLVAIRIALQLRRTGIVGTEIVRVLEAMRTAGFEALAKVSFGVTRNGDVAVRSREGELISARRNPGQLLFEFTCDCRQVVTDLRDQLQRTVPYEKVKVRQAPKKPVIRAGENSQIKKRRA